VAAQVVQGVQQQDAHRPSGVLAVEPGPGQSADAGTHDHQVLHLGVALDDGVAQGLGVVAPGVGVGPGVVRLALQAGAAAGVVGGRAFRGRGLGVRGQGAAGQGQGGGTVQQVAALDVGERHEGRG
jgi:hypothetical protein